MILMRIAEVILSRMNIINMNVGLENILNNIQSNFIEGYYSNSIIKKYRANNNIRFNFGDEDSFLFIDQDYYYYYIYLYVFKI